MTADDKICLLNRGNLTQPIQILIFEKKKIFSEFISEFLKSMLNFENFLKKYDSHGWCISEITESEKLGQIIV